MLSATADSNIYISGFEFGGLPRQFIDSARAGLFRLDISEAIKQEVLPVLRDKFEYSLNDLHDVGLKLDTITRQVAPADVLDVIKIDPSDNRILECALAAQSDFIVSGDARHVLSVGSYKGIQVVSVARFLELLKRSE